MSAIVKFPSFSEQSPKKVPPAKKAFGSRRKYLTEAEVAKLERAALAGGRYGERDALMIRMCYRHALRASELVSLTWQQVDLVNGEIRIERKKNGKNSVHPLNAQEKKRLAKLKKDGHGSGFVFQSERSSGMGERAFFKIVQEAGKDSGLAEQIGSNINPHMLRHAAGYELINKDADLRTIQDYMGHRNIQNTSFYTELNPKKFQRVSQLLK